MSQSSKRLRVVASVIVGLAAHAADPAGAQHHDHRVAGPAVADVVRVETTCRPSVAAVLDRGVHQVHTFAFDDALGNFRLAAHSDVDCTMAYWGTAMAHWGRFARSGRPEALAEGWRALDQAALLRRPPSDRERRYLDALAVRYRERLGAGPVRYADAMTALADAFPADPHAALFAALARLEQPAATAAEAITAGRAALALLARPAVPASHASALHYAVLAGDLPELAADVLPQAHALAAAAEPAPQVQLAPALVFERLGLWPEGIAVSRRAADTARAAHARDAELRALDLLSYAELQSGRDGDARALSRRIAAGYLADAADASAAWTRAAIVARIAVESTDPAAAAAVPMVGDADTPAAAPIHFARAVGAARAGRPGDATRAAALLTALPIDDRGGADAQRLLAEAATAWVAFAHGRRDEAIGLMRAAADREDGRAMRGVWRRPVWPAREQLAELLLAAGRAREAAAAFATVLARAPGRARAVAGAAAATRRGGNRR
jgi:hypothetical protein